MFISLVNKFYMFCGVSMDVVSHYCSSLFTRMPLCVMSSINDKQANLTWFFLNNSIHSASFSELFMCRCYKSSKTNKGGTTVLALSPVWVCAAPSELHSLFLKYTKGLWPHLKFQGCCFRLLDVLDWSQTWVQRGPFGQQCHCYGLCHLN